MPRHSPQGTTGFIQQPSAAGKLAVGLGEEQLSRWADLIAQGLAPFPLDLAADQRDQLLAEVRRRRRDRLVQWIVGAIGIDLRRSSFTDEVT